MVTISNGVNMEDHNLQQIEDHRFIPMTSLSAGKVKEISDDVIYFTNQIVNVIFIGASQQEGWVLVDAGMPGAASKIIKVAEERFGPSNKPAAIILTHGHFDHVGSIVELVSHWQVPVYAHPSEFPYLSGLQDYPEPDTSVEGGLLAKISSLYPHKAIDIEEVLLALPEDGSLPYLPATWRWVHTPGHSPGHVSLFRLKDRLLIAGDAFVTVRQDSLYKVLTQTLEVNGPPRYLTTDWKLAYESVKTLQLLDPQIAVTGHGQAMSGQELKDGLTKLVNEFDTMALPEYGKYVDNN